MKDKKALIALIITVLIWGSSFTAIKILLEEIRPLGLSFLRSGVAAAGLILLLGFNEGFMKIKRALKEKFLHFVLLGTTGVALFNLFQNTGIEYTSSGIASVLLATNPLFVLTLSTVFLQEKINRKKITGMVLGFVGIVITIFGGKNIMVFFLSSSFIGNVLVLLSALCWSLYVVISKKVLRQYSPLLLTTFAFVFGSLLLLVLCLFSHDFSRIINLSSTSLLLVIYLGFISSGLAYLFWNYALNRMEASKASVFLFLIPVVAIILGKVILAEKITFSLVVGTCLVLSGIYLVER
ncbi:DMT family transporter [Candidatus Aerophobetes bacterium]|nr:DMT family transporter [Candidatus Aerophobetes bacterium]